MTMRDVAASALPPALTMPLTGVHLIEASAGTGKTWTLTALIVRILAQAHVQPKQLIATTFTRAAAAEMRTRVENRLKTLIDLFAGIQHADSMHALLQHEDALVGYYAQHFLQQTSTAGTADLAACVSVWVKHLQHQFIQLDEVFIGTLDSLCQRILRDFPIETACFDTLQLTTDESYYRLPILHDTLRAWISAQPHALITLLIEQNTLKTVDAYDYELQTAWQFPDTPIIPPAPCVFAADFPSALQQQLQAITVADLEALARYTARVSSIKMDMEHFLYIWPTWQRQAMHMVDTHADVLTWLHWLVKEIDFKGKKHLDKDNFEQELLNKFKPPTKKSLATLGAAAFVDESDYYDTFKHNAIMQWLHHALLWIKAQQQAVNYAIAELRIQLIEAVRTHLPQQLAQQGISTFSHNLLLLKQALQGEAGAAFARRLRTQYPYILVDEYQDTNALQAHILQRIYPLVPTVATSASVPYLSVYIGDPKQSIYGFRGGDVSNYLQSKQHIPAECQHTLATNFRSSPALIAAYNHLFLANPVISKGILYNAVDAPMQRTAKLCVQQQPLPSLLALPCSADMEAETVAEHIAQQLNNAAIRLGERRLMPEDIAVLAPNHKILYALEEALRQRNIAVWRQNNESIFSSTLARECLYLLLFWQQPEQHALFYRLMLGPLFAEPMDVLAQFQDNPLHVPHLHQRQHAMMQDALIWQQQPQQGFFNAIHQWLNREPTWQVLAKQSIRYVHQLRQLLSVIGQWCREAQHTEQVIQQLQDALVEQNKYEDSVEVQFADAPGVRLLTMHASKGLEFPIVYVLDKKIGTAGKAKAVYRAVVADNSAEHCLDVRPCEENDVPLPTAVPFMSSAEVKEQHKKDIQDEERRLLYVAITRAKEQVCLLIPRAEAAQTPAKKATKVLQHWLGIDYAELARIPHSHVAEPLHTVDDPLPCTPYSSVVAASVVPQLLVAPFAIYAWQTSSFSRMARYAQADYKNIPTAMVEGSSALPLPKGDELHAADVNGVDAQATTVPIADVATEDTTPSMRIVFPRGTAGGNALHHILEHIDPQKPDYWRSTVERQLQAHQFSHVDADAVMDWLYDIVHTPMLPSAQTPMRLVDIPPHHRLPELSFQMALHPTQRDMAQLYALFAHIGINLPTLQPMQHVRFLSGAIDLVFAYQQHYYVADYKSNVLEDYTHEHLHHAMLHGVYYLQAAIYLVALHRFLSCRLPHYDMDTHLGGAAYLFVRGMTPVANSAYSDSAGVLLWRPPNAFIIALNQCLA